ncbi:MAG: hypothetical protein ACI9VS_004160 [Candidatus Binatia bacterium]|jgi:hypothetical protein
MISRPTNYRFAEDCSRPSGLKSSPNQVHLKIHHVLKDTSYPNRTGSIAVFSETTTIFFTFFQALNYRESGV